MAEVTFGEWLKRRRKGMGLTQQQPAAQINCSTIMLKKIEAEERRPSAQIVERLAEIFNVPTTERAKFLRFTRGDWQARPLSESEDVPWRDSAASSRSNLPASLTSFIGRTPDLVSLSAYLTDGSKRLVTLTGPPGIGKTRLSIEAARAALPNFSEGVFFIALAPLDDPSLIAPAIVQTLGYVEAKNQSASQQLKDGIGDKRILIVLDNCEHLIEEASRLASDLLFACSRLTILATSRESLRVPGEWLYPVPALELPAEASFMDAETASNFPALTLFAERARAVRPDFALNPENIRSVSDICAQVDGLPLAIELLAARMRVMSPQALLARLNDQFILSADGMRAASARQKTLHNALAWSYNLLSPAEQNMFAYLSVFSGGFTLEAVEAIGSQAFTDKPISDHITSLLDKSLLQRVMDERGEPRFTMLVTVQQFALDRLRSTGEESNVRNAHLAYFLESAERTDGEIHGPRQVELIKYLDREHHNFRAALEWCVSGQKTESALRLLGSLRWSWLIRIRFSEMRTWFDQIRSLPGITAYPALYARLLNHIGRQSWLLSDFPKARSVLNEGQALWLRLGVEGEQGLAECFCFLSMVASSTEGDNKTAQSLFEQSLELYRKHSDRRGMAYAMFNLGLIVGEQDEDDRALSLLEQSLDMYRQLGDVWGQSRASENLGRFFLKRARYEKARVFFEQQLKGDEELDFKPAIMSALLNLGNLYLHQGDDMQSEQYVQKSLFISRESGLKWFEDLSNYYLGVIGLYRGEYALARRYFMNYYKSIQGFEDKPAIGEMFMSASAIAAGMNKPEDAARLQGAAQAVLETADYQISPIDLAEFDRHIQIARKQLGEVEFQRLQIEGRAMTMEQAVAYALEDEISSDNAPNSPQEI